MYRDHSYHADVNLTGNSPVVGVVITAVDIRGMGPENTLILIDGKPVSSYVTLCVRAGVARYPW